MAFWQAIRVVDFKVTLYDGSYHDVDSSEMAFKIAGSMAFKEASRAANPVLLEPMMKVEVEVPEEYMGDVIGDLNRRRGQINSMDDRLGLKIRTPLCRWWKCLVILRICDQPLKGVGLTLWSLIIMAKCLAISSMKL